MVIDRPEAGETGIGLRHYLDVVRRRKWIVLTVIAMATGGAALVSALQEPVYRATTKIVVGQGSGLIPAGEAYAIPHFTATMGDLVESDVVARNVIENLNLKDETPQSLLERTSVSINPDTAVVKVAVEDRDKARAVRIAGQIGTVFADLVEEQFGKPTAPAPGEAPEAPLTAKVFDPAHPDPDTRVAPKPVRNIAIAGVLGLILGLLAAFLREHFDRKLRTREAVEQSFGVPVIGQVPFRKQRGRRPATVADESREVGEAYRALRANLQYLAVKRPLRTILITSAAPAQGKTTVTANLAVAIARSGATTIAVEGDLRRPQLVQALGAPRQWAGLTTLLVGNGELESALTDVALTGSENGAGPGSDDRVSFLPSGPLPPNPSELLSSAQMKDVLEQLTNLFDYVLIDSPPILLVADALELGRMVAGVVLVVRRNRATTDEAREVRALIERLDINLLGVVFTDVEPVGAYYGAYEPTQPLEKRRVAETSPQLAQEEL